MLPKKPRSAIKKDLIAFFGEGRRTPAPSTEGSPIETVKQRREHSSAGQGDVEPVIVGKTVDNNSWLTPTVKKKRDKTKSITQDEENEKDQGKRQGEIWAAILVSFDLVVNGDLGQKWDIQMDGSQRDDKNV